MSSPLPLDTGALQLNLRLNRRLLRMCDTVLLKRQPTSC